MKYIYILSAAFTVFASCSSEPSKEEGVILTVQDIDGNIYQTTNIYQSYPEPTTMAERWTTENLEVKHYRNGDVIPQVQDDSQWSTLTTGAWCYAPDGSILYNWFAVTDSRGLAPGGSHIPSDEEWNWIKNHVATSASGFRKENGWDCISTNATGFSSVPGFYRLIDGTFYDEHITPYWTTTDYNGDSMDTDAISYAVSCDEAVIRNAGFKNDGYAVRVIMGN